MADKHHKKDAADGETEGRGIPIFSVTAFVTATVGEAIYVGFLLIALPLMLFMGVGAVVGLMGLAMRQIFASVLLIYAWTQMEGPHSLKEYEEAAVHTALNPIGFFFSPRTIMIATWLIPLPGALMGGLVFAIFMQNKFIRFVTQQVVEQTAIVAGTVVAGALTLPAGGAGGVAIAAAGETAALGGTVAAEGAVVAGEVVVEGAVAAGEAAAEAGGQAAIRAGEEVVAKGAEGLGKEALKEAKEIPETAFGMPEGPFETMEHEAFPEPQPPKPGSAGAPLPSAEELNAQSLYERLGVSPEADETTIKEAYRNKSKIFHPDKNLEADTNPQMRSMNDAYETLKNADKRAAYDKSMKSMGSSPSAAAQPMESSAKGAADIASEGAEKSGAWDRVKHELKEGAKYEAENRVLEGVFGEKEEDEDDIDQDLDLRQAA